MQPGADRAIPTGCKVLLVCPKFDGRSFWNFTATCKLFGASIPAPPLGLITVAALLPADWQPRLVNRNAEELTQADLDWADLVMTGGMMPQRTDALEVIALAQARGKPVAVGGPDVTTSPEAYERSDFRVLGEAENIIDEFIAAWNSGVRQGMFEAEKFKADVTKTPVPRYDLLTRSHYIYYGVQFARGCPFTCEFCDIIELYGRAPRVKTAAQMLGELDALYDTGYRGHLDFVDDNFIGNKKAVKAFLPHLIGWQKAHRYPFEFSTEASINLADDDELLELMREANFFTVFVGIESPDPATLVSMQKKQNTRRVLAESVHRIYRAGMFVNAGFILGFDTETQSVADAMVDCIEATAIPVATVGLLTAIPTTQLSRRLEREDRMLTATELMQLGTEEKGGDHSTLGLNFRTARPRRDILADYKDVLKRVYDVDAYYGRVQRMMDMLDRPDFGMPAAQSPGPRIAGVPVRDVVLLWRLVVTIVRVQPKVLPRLARVFYRTLRRNPQAVGWVFFMAAFYLHLGPFSRFVIGTLERQIAILDAAEAKPAPARLDRETETLAA
jgi:radical SAM superfamily enzyme YgiQ (UPF0313 family)